MVRRLYRLALERLSTPQGGSPSLKSYGDRLALSELPFSARSMRRTKPRKAKKMPISQVTMLLVYGMLCDLVEEVQAAADALRQPTLLAEAQEPQEAALALLDGLRARSYDLHRAAIAAMLQDDKKLKIHPLTGRVG